MKFLSCFLFFFLIQMHNTKQIPTHLHNKRVPSNRINLKLRGVNPHHHKSVVHFNEIPSNVGETNLGIGSPVPQRLMLQFDTDSKDLWVFSSKYFPCDLYSEFAIDKSHKLWNETKSTTYKTSSPRRGVALSERYFEWVFGYYGQDRLSILNINVDDVGFIQVLKASYHPAKLNYDGAFGLQYNPKKDGLVKKICQKLQGNYLFSIHYPRIRTINTDFSDGEITLCGDDKSKYDSSRMTHVDTIEPGIWHVSMTRVAVQETSRTVEISPRVAAAMDPSTYYIEGPVKPIDTIYTLLKNYSVPDPENEEFPCYIVRILPAILFTMNEVDYSLQGYDYSYEVKIGKAKGCRILIKRNIHNKHWILGEPFFRKYYAKFDMEHHRIGFAENKII